MQVYVNVYRVWDKFSYQGTRHKVKGASLE